MTRGTFYLITGERIIASCEFNGDMYGSPKDKPELQKAGHYKEAIRRLKKVKTIQDFKEAIRAFGKANFSYNDFEFYEQSIKEWRNKNNEIEMTDSNYFDRYFSDYLYFKNCSKKTIDIRDRKGTLVKIKPMEIATFNFGRVIEVM